jgi:transcriptional regulator with XRE-family HTH domain
VSLAKLNLRFNNRIAEIIQNILFSFTSLLQNLFYCLFCSHMDAIWEANVEIGQRIKQLRVMKGLTQEELADRAELSKGFISQVERDLTSPSIATLMDILQCLGVSVSEFFTEEPEEQIVFTKEDYFIKKDEENENTIEWIVPNAQKNQMEPILLKLEPGGSTDPDNPHEGEEFGYVLNGAVTIHLGNKVYRAKKGETFYYVSGKQHYLTSKVGATVLWISSPPTF